jgi:primosomal protein N' (replication factor Y)
MIAKVIVDVAHSAVDQVYDYLIPEDLETFVRVGQRVEIPFGNRTISGIIVEFSNESLIKTLKPIKRILDIIPLYNDEMITLVHTLSKTYMTPKMHYFNAILPSALKMQYKKALKVHDRDALDERLHHYFKKDTVHVNKIEASDEALIHKMIESGVIEVITLVKQRHGIKQEMMIVYEKDMPLKGLKQQAILDVLKQEKAIEQTLLLKKAEASTASLNAIIDKGIAKKVAVETYRDIEHFLEIKKRDVTLNDEQVIAYEAVKEALNTHQTFLLHGITSSGKTEVYIELAKTVIHQGKSVLMLVPEISLTPLLTARFKAVFDEEVAVYHSKLSIGEQYDEWRKVLKGEAKILIGARSAIFAPMKSIGLIIIDEEHSDSYYQSDMPIYDAKAIAQFRANWHQAPILLGSATPSIDSYYKAKNHDYSLLTLTKRALKSKLPAITIVDMKEEFIKGNKSIFSTALKEALETRYKNHEQSLLLINRRGHANFVLCRSCGEAIKCDHCDITMTYHHHDQSLKCHYCNHHIKVPKVCPNCQSPHIRYMGLGSEQVEETLKAMFKDAKIYRMDKDTTSEKQGHEKILAAFEKDGDFLVGTQMISKGLDFDHVTLVGILSADMSLHIPSFNAKEETFNLLTQVAGRSGRRKAQGDVIIQAYDASHPLLESVTQHDYVSYVNRELAYREKALMPPFTKAKKITITHTTQNESYKKATQIKMILKKELPSSYKIIGPIKPKIAKINKLYRTHILVKYTDETPLINLLNAIHENFDYKLYGFIVTDDINMI